MVSSDVSPRDDAKAGAAVDAALEELYAAPFERFVLLRRQLVSLLRAKGDGAGARLVGAAAKPTRTVWGLNQVARHRGDLMLAVIESWRAATEDAARVDGSAIRDGARRHREALAEAVREAGRILALDSVSLSAHQARRMTETLHALVIDEAERRNLLRGRLTRDIVVDDPFAGLDAGGLSASARRDATKTASESRSFQAEREALRQSELERARAAKQRAIDEAQRRVAALEASVSEARHKAREAEGALARAEEEARRMAAAAHHVEDELARERHRLEHLAR